MLPDGRRVAVELECSAKGSARYRSILGSYAAGMAYERVRWFVYDRHLRDRLADLIRAERLDDLVSIGLHASPMGRDRRPGMESTASAPAKIRP